MTPFSATMSFCSTLARVRLPITLDTTSVTPCLNTCVMMDWSGSAPARVGCTCHVMPWSQHSDIDG